MLIPLFTLVSLCTFVVRISDFSLDSLQPSTIANESTDTREESISKLAIGIYNTSVLGPLKIK